MQKKSPPWASLSTGTQLLILGITIAAVFMLIYLAITVSMLHMIQMAGHILLLTALVTLAGRYPVLVMKGIKVNVADTPVFAAVLTLNPLAAMLVALVGRSASNAILKRPWYNTLYNAASYGLSAGIASLLYSCVVGEHAEFVPVQPLQAVMLGPVAFLFYLLNLLTFTGIVSVFGGERLWTIITGYCKKSFLQDATLLLFGIAAAMIPFNSFWMASVVALPVLVVYQSWKRGRDLQIQTNQALERLADVVDRRDRYTFEHSRRVAEYSREIALAMKLPVEQVDLIMRSARVHDVGKVGLPDNVLLKAGPLSDEEYSLMKQHPAIGADILKDFPGYAAGRDLILYHHERLDGSGYPMKLRGEAIPLGARIIGVADSFDAMTSNRVYRVARTFESACAELERCKGTLYDPTIVDTFIALIRERAAQGAQLQGDVLRNAAGSLARTA